MIEMHRRCRRCAGSLVRHVILLKAAEHPVFGQGSLQNLRDVSQRGKPDLDFVTLGQQN